jgi:hypothetical protein
MKEKMLKLYEDWKLSQDGATQNLAEATLRNAASNPAHFNTLVKMMGHDGKLFTKYFTESALDINPLNAKRKAAQYICEITIGTDGNWTDTGGNTIESEVNLTGTRNSLPSDILQAIVSGDIQIAAALIGARWTELNAGDLAGIMRAMQAYGYYNQQTSMPDNEVPKTKAKTKYYTIDKKSDTTKDEFISKVFPKSDPSLSKLY